MAVVVAAVVAVVGLGGLGGAVAFLVFGAGFNFGGGSGRLRGGGGSSSVFHKVSPWRAESKTWTNQRKIPRPVDLLGGKVAWGAEMVGAAHLLFPFLHRDHDHDHDLHRDQHPHRCRHCHCSHHPHLSLLPRVRHLSYLPLPHLRGHLDCSGPQEVPTGFERSARSSTGCVYIQHEKLTARTLLNPFLTLMKMSLYWTIASSSITPFDLVPSQT